MDKTIEVPKGSGVVYITLTLGLYIVLVNIFNIEKKRVRGREPPP
jgi:hypothetical protein